MSGSTRLIVNADDIGYTEAVTDTILACHDRGIVTSATLMVNMPAARYAAQASTRHPELSIGLHLNLTEGRPVAETGEVAGLLDESGHFLDNARQTASLWRGRSLYPQVLREVRAQLRHLLDLGIAVSHADSHHGIHKLPVVARALADALEEHGILRARTPLSRHRLIPGTRSASAYRRWLRLVGRRLPVIAVLTWNHSMLERRGIRLPAWKATRDMGIPSGAGPKEQLIATIRAIPRGRTSEILLHPGSAGAGAPPSEWHAQTWAEDTPICLDPEVRGEIDRLGIQLVSFRDL